MGVQISKSYTVDSGTTYYQGCYDPASLPSFTYLANYGDAFGCARGCGSRGYAHCLVRPGGQCWGSNEALTSQLGAVVIDDCDCMTECGTFGFDACGGNVGGLVYGTDAALQKTPKTCDATTTSTTTTSTATSTTATTTTTTAPTATPTIFYHNNGLTYSGCYPDTFTPAGLTLLGTGYSGASACIEDCGYADVAFCIVQADACYSAPGADYAQFPSALNDSECKEACPEDGPEACGGETARLFYKSDDFVPPTSTASDASATSSATSPAETTPVEDTTPKISQAIDGYTYSGCYTDAFTPDGLSSLGRGFQTADACVAACAEAGAAACHVHIEWCYSSSGIDYASFPTALSDSYCSEACYGDAEQSCGADSGRLYYVLANPSTATSAASGASSTATDISSSASSDSSSVTSDASSSDSITATSTTDSATSTSSSIASAPTATIVMQSDDWSYKKCVHPNTYINPLTLGETTTVEACLDLCSTSRYVDAVSNQAYITCFVTGTGACAAATMQWEDAIREGYKIGDEDCVGSPCAGDAGESCGGSAGQLVYALPEATTTTTTTLTTPTSDAASSTSTTAPVNASGKVVDPDWNYVGCYTDSTAARTLVNGLGSQDWTATNCLSLAAAAGYRYVGIIYGGECWGANEITTGVEQDASACNWRCANNEEGDETTCGGEAGLDLYETTLPIPTTTTTSAAASASSSAPTKASSAGWTYAGCFSDLREARSVENHLDTSPWTVETCLNAAQAAGYQVAGIIYGGECWGANSVASTAVALDADQCQWKCNNDENTYCGGESALDVYVFDLATKFVADKEWSYTGCYTDSISARTLPHGLGSQHWDIQTCLDLAAAAEYKYAGIIYGGECWGANKIAPTGTAQSLDKCNWDCNDARGVETCGGEAGLDVYQVRSTVVPTKRHRAKRFH